MVDRNNLHRIKGILSAKQGAEIPKFQGGAKFAMYGNNQTIYSADRSKWFLDTNLTQAYTGSLAGFKSIQFPTQTSSQITGANPAEGNANAAVENAASANASVEAIQNEQVAQATAARRMETLPAISSSILPENKVTYNGLSPEERFKQEMSAGMNLRAEQQALQNTEALNKAQKWGNVGQAATDAITTVGNAFGAKQAATDSDTTKTVDMVYNGAADAISNLGPYGKAIGGAMKIAGAAGNIIQEMGGGTDQQTTVDKWMDSAFFSWNIGMLNGFAGKNTDSFGADMDTLAAVGSSYGGTAADISDAADKAGKKYGLFSTKARKKANEAIAQAKSQQNLMGSIADNATDQRLAVQSMGEQAGLAYSLMTDGGYNQKYTYAAKQGGMLEWNPVETLEWEPQVELNWELPKFKEGGNIDIVEELEWIPEFRSGGKTLDTEVPEIEETAQKNVIPEGALHKNKHHMEHADGLTKKGIPVIDDEGEQQAEIEHSEIIFTLEVTKKLEEYYDIFYSDESSNKDKEQAALEAGRLLVYQILENTEDRTGLIDSCKKGGSLTLKKSTDDLIEETLEWMPTLIVVEEVIEDTPKEEKKDDKEKSEKEQMKEAIREVLIELLTK